MTVSNPSELAAATGKRAPPSALRTAAPSDFSAVLASLVVAFDMDPVWGGWAFPACAAATEQRRALFALWLRDAMSHGTVSVSGDCEAVALWYPPGGTADSEEYRQELQAVAAELGAHAPVFLEGCARFSASHPPGRYWYLALLAVRTDRRGQGLGMKLLRACLDAPEFQCLPVYLESTNPRNLHRYRQLGFRKLGELTLPAGPSVDRLWRDPVPVTPSPVSPLQLAG
jgi:ribosomal protein S18 acetylase RimI-like enzyme